MSLKTDTNRWATIAIVAQIAATVIAFFVYYISSLPEEPPEGGEIEGAPAAVPGAAGREPGAAEAPAFVATAPPSQPTYRANPARTGFYDSLSVDPLHGLKWRTQSSIHTHKTSPVISEGVIYFGTNEGYLVAVEAATGRELWSYRISGNVPVPSPPAISGETAYFAGESSAWSFMFALDLKTRSLKWSYPASTSASTLAAVDSFYFTNRDNLYALDAASGAPKWTFPVKSTNTSAPSLADGILYFACHCVVDNAPAYLLYAVDAANGKEIWKINLPETILGDPVVSQGVIYAVTSNNSTIPKPPGAPSQTAQGAVYAVDAKSGAVIWKYEDAIIQSRPVAIAGDSLIIAYEAGASGNSRKYVRAIDAKSGAGKWAIETGSILSAPSLAGSSIYIVHRKSRDAKSPPSLLSALDLSSGEESWSYDLQDPNAGFFEPVVNDGVIFLSNSNSGKFMAVN